jgi:hypothetical protein
VVLHGARAIEQVQAHARVYSVPNRDEKPRAVGIPKTWQEFCKVRGYDRARILVIRDRRGHKGSRPKKWWVQKEEVPENAVPRRTQRAVYNPPTIADPGAAQGFYNAIHATHQQEAQIQQPAQNLNLADTVFRYDPVGGARWEP